jgi:hypothetical protein
MYGVIHFSASLLAMLQEFQPLFPNQNLYEEFGIAM